MWNIILNPNINIAEDDKKEVIWQKNVENQAIVVIEEVDSFLFHNVRLIYQKDAEGEDNYGI